jgi:hypothetical protein
MYFTNDGDGGGDRGDEASSIREHERADIDAELRVA